MSEPIRLDITVRPAPRSRKSLAGRALLYVGCFAFTWCLVGIPAKAPAEYYLRSR